MRSGSFASMIDDLTIDSTTASSGPPQRGRFLQGTVDYERRDTRSTKTPQRPYRPSPSYSVGSIFAHETTVIGQLRAFFRGRESETGPARSERAVSSWQCLPEATETHGSSLPNIRPDPHVHPVCVDGDLSVQVGPVDRSANRFETSEDLGRGVAERVATAAADDGNLRPPPF
jgi:hypothetical protein